MNCGNCGAANPAGSRFCRNCGQALTAPSPPPPPASGRQDRCANCGAALPEGAQFCADCGTRVGTAVATTGPASGAGSAPTFDAGSMTHWLAEGRRYGWKRLWPLAALAIYVLVTKNVMVLVIGFVIAFVIRRYSTRIDQALRPVWPIRNRIPAGSRKVLGWVVPVAISLYISLTPAVWPLLGWLPLVGPSGSLTVFTALLAALSAYVFVREPRQLGVE
jgi:double zinc ribbon protein